MRANASIPDMGYRCISLEVGAAGRRRARSREIVGDNVRISRVSHSTTQAIACAERVAPYGFEMIEEPLHFDDFDGLAA